MYNHLENDLTNLLAQETSPYLRQHADNPVEWHAWNEEALELAKSKDRPILLSIGYSACHWCHVMAHESFEDTATAQLMNELFINIKVDREERPDLDKIYQTSQYLLNQRSGGWPLTMFLTPEDQVPFFGGTYFPPEARHGLPAFKDVLRHIATLFQQRRADILTQNQSMQHALAQIYASSTEDLPLDQSIFTKAEDQLLQSFDRRFGGFGKAPKFPHPTSIERLLRSFACATGRRQEELLQAATFSLDAMCNGGVFDQIGGGFFRYSVDDYWMIPHFEKMLYDNGALTALYCQAFLITRAPAYDRTIRKTCDWVMREMQSPEGAYYSSLDADSEGTEGKFYVWTVSQLKSLLEPEEFQLARTLYGLSRTPNFDGSYHLHRFCSLDEAGSALAIGKGQVLELLGRTHTKLFQAREQRIHPLRDEKVLTSWNSLMIKGMTMAGRVLEYQPYVESADQAIQFIQLQMVREGRLLATYKDGRAHLNAYLDDYAFLLDCLLEHLQSRWDTNILTFAQQLADAILLRFQDAASGGFYFTSHDHEALIQRPKTNADEATPAGSAVATQALNRLGYLLGENRYLEAADRAIRSATHTINDNPMAHGSFLTAIEEQLHPPEIVILRGESSSSSPAIWQQQAQAAYKPQRMVFFIPLSANNLPETLKSKTHLSNQQVTAYICRGKTCLNAISEFEEYVSVLG